jgi:hypothetical protein
MNKRYLTIILFVFCCNLAFGQDHAPSWGGGADQKDLSFGFTFAYVSNYYKIDKKPNWRNPFYDPQNGNELVTPALNSISSANAPGFAVGFLTRYRITEHLEARFSPLLVFADRTASYGYVDTTYNVTKSVSTTTIDFPILLKIKSDRIDDYRGYIIAGLKYSYSLGANKPDPNDGLIDKTLKNTSAYSSYEVGIGMDIYFEYFKLSPEIKLSNSFGNILFPENTPYATPISKLSLHSVMFSLCFE